MDKPNPKKQVGKKRRRLDKPSRRDHMRCGILANKGKHRLIGEKEIHRREKKRD